MSASVLGNRVLVAGERDEWEALTLCPGSASGAWFPEQQLGWVDFYSIGLATEARLGLGL